MFESAVRNKYRFPFRGLISVEDLWDLSVQNLDEIFKTLNSQMKVVKEESLLTTKSAADAELEAKIQIVKHIVAVKLAEVAKAKEAKALKEKKQKIMAILADKQDEELHNKSAAELEAMLEAMN